MKKHYLILMLEVFLILLLSSSPINALKIPFNPFFQLYPAGSSQFIGVNPLPFGGLLPLLSSPILAPPAPILPAPINLVTVRTQGTVLPTTLITPLVALPPPVPIVIVTTNWIGSWYAVQGSVGPQTGALALQLTQNTFTGELTGLVDFSVDSLLPEPVPVTGIMLPGATTFVLEGIYYDPLELSRTANIDLVCTLTSSTTIAGTYSILSWHGPSYGSIYLVLL